MSPVLRRLFTVASALSLLLCMGTAALWVRSHWAGDSVGWYSADPRSLQCVCRELNVGNGLVRFDWSRDRLETPEAYHLTVAERQYTLDSASPVVYVRFQPVAYTLPRNSILARLGFWFQSSHQHLAEEDYFAWEWVRSSDGPHRRPVRQVGAWWGDSSTVCFPIWPVTVILFLAALPWLRRLRLRLRRLRHRPGCCVNCGYDLRATPDRCPECGHVSAEPAPGGLMAGATLGQSQ